jgi:hypothetical protein
VLPAAPRFSRLWPMVGGALVWAARELLPEVLTAWRASHATGSQPTRFKPNAFNQRTPTTRQHGHRYRWGRV